MNDLSEFVSLENNVLVTDSLRVARHFGKQHKHVLRAIDNMEIKDDLRKRIFAFTFLPINMPFGAVRQDRAVRMTKDGFILLVMGFSGRQAMDIKVAYLEAFNALEAQSSVTISALANDFWTQCLTLEKVDATTFEFASSGSKQMLRRKKMLPLIGQERARLKEEMEPGLFDKLGALPGVSGVR